MKTIILLASLLLTQNSMASVGSDCPATKQKVLIIDLKSGWWQGDGGNTHELVTKLIQGRCPHVTLEYRHSTYGGYGFGFGGGGFGSFNPSKPVEELNQMDPTSTGANKFPKDDFATYNQIWLLSGGEADSVDLRIESAEFQRYLAGIESSKKSSLFVGTGFGNIYHAKEVLEAVTGSSIVETNRETHEYPSAMSVVKTERALSSKQLYKNASLFRKITELPDVVKVGEYTVIPDWISEAGLDVVVPLATNTDGQVVIAQVKSKRKVIIDTNLARTYEIQNKNPAIDQYLINLVRVLETRL